MIAHLRILLAEKLLLWALSVAPPGRAREVMAGCVADYIRIRLVETENERGEA